jgi:hypothetical protein
LQSGLRRDAFGRPLFQPVEEFVTKVALRRDVSDFVATAIADVEDVERLIGIGRDAR